MSDDLSGVLPVPSPGILETGELPPIVRDPSRPVRRRRIRPIGLTIKVVAFAAVIYFLVLPLIPGFRSAATELTKVRPAFLIGGLLLEMSSWFCYSLLTRSALGESAATVSRMRMFRIQMSTKALSNIVPGGSAAGPALGYRLLTLSGARGPDAGFALATAGLGSAVVLNLIFWIALVISIPLRGVNPLYVTAALVGVLVMVIATGVVLGLIHGQGPAEKVVRSLAVKFRFDADNAVTGLRQVGERVEDLIADRVLLRKVVGFSAAAWLLDAAALWVFLRAYGGTLDLDGLLVVFGLANVVAAIPITPGGLGLVETTYITTLVGFGMPRRVATLGVASYRLAQYWLPIVLGGLTYASLRVGPWSISRRDRLERLRDIAARETEESERRIDFAMRQWERTRKGVVIETPATQAPTVEMEPPQEARDNVPADDGS